MEETSVALRNDARNHHLRLVDVARGVIDGTVAVPRLGSSPPAEPS